MSENGAPADTAFGRDQYALAYPEGIAEHWWHLARNRIVERALRRAGGARAPVLDVGCGRGIAVAYLRRRGIACFGVEVAEVEPLAGLENAIATGTAAEALPAAERSRFRTALLLDVLEHIEQPQAFLDRLCTALPDLERLVVTVPARPEVWSSYDRTYGHFRRYSRSALAAEAVAAGLRTASCGYFFHGLYWAARLQRAVGRRRAERVRAPAGWWRPVHRLLGAGFVLEQRLVPAGWRGLSILAVLEVPKRDRPPG